jgi:transcription-repair coupling factor (superfamily II helicase)
MGNLLGADQSGNMEAIGFDLYCKMVQETINELKGEPIPEPSEVKLDIPMRALLPTDYIPDEKQKFTLYRKFADARTIRDVDAIEEELLDRFGPLPEDAQNLTEMVRVRCMALHKDIIYIKVDTEQVVLQWKTKIPGYALKAFETLKGIQIRVIPPDQMVLKRLQKATKDPIIQAKLLMQKLFSVD